MYVCVCVLYRGGYAKKQENPSIYLERDKSELAGWLGGGQGEKKRKRKNREGIKQKRKRKKERKTKTQTNKQIDNCNF